MLRGGVRPSWLVQCRVLLDLDYVRREAGADTHDPYVRALALERILLESIATLGDGPEGRAAAMLFGAHVQTRGRLLKDRRHVAAAELDLLPSSFRKNHEAPIVADVAFEVWRIITSARAET